MPASRSRFRRSLVLLPLLTGLAAPGLLGPAHAAPGATAGTIPSPPTTPEQKSLLLQMQDAFTNIAQTVEPTVVNIKAERLRGADGADGAGDGSPVPPPRRRGGTPPGGLPFPVPRRSQATGSGVIVRADGYILTNDHVVEGASGGVVTVTLADGREYQGRVYADFKSDLAVVKIDPGTTPLPVAGFADSSVVRPGQWAVAIGSPFDLQNTMTVGVISAVGRHQSIGGDSSARYYPDLIQTDAAINPGNSGGPLFNIDGKVVGINVAIESPVEGSAGVGFAIPSAIAQSVMNSLIQSGRVTRGYLGIAPEDLSPALQAQYGQKEGAFVRDVRLDSPAGKAGMQAADIVTSYDGKPISSEVGLRAMISATPPARTVAIAYVRDGQPGVASVTLGTAPVLPTESAPDKPAVPTAIKLGLTVRDLTAADRVGLRLPPTTTGVFIVGMDSGGPVETAAMMTGLTLSGAVLQKLGRKTITTKADYTQAVAALSSGAGTTLVLLTSDAGQIHQTAVTLRL
jgi:serine protease Do